jgi:protease secretion system outer membrane protein
MIRIVRRPREGGRPRGPGGPGGACGHAGAALLLVLLAIAAAPATQAQPAGAFGAAFDAALANDAEYRASRFELQGREQAVPIARAGLLPSLTATYSESRVRGEREQLNSIGQEFTQRLDYRNPLAALQFRTPLVNFEALRRYEASQAQIDGARALFAASGQQLLDRLGTAYVQRLFGEALVALARAQVEAFRVQSDAATRRFGGGEGTRTDVAEAAAALALARAQLVEAMDQRDVSQRTLARITGLPSPPLRGLADDTRPLPMPYDNVDDWIQAAYAGNPNVQARAHLLEAARIEVKRSQAGHLPRLDLVANAVDSQNESISTLNQQVRQYSAGIQLSIPIFAGGSVEARVAQAEAEALRVESQLEADRLTLAVDIRRQFQITQTGLAKIEAYKDAIAASAVALEGNQRGLAAGVRTTVDVNEATRRLFVARRDFAQARYEVLLARLRLQTLAGLPPADIVQDIDRHLTAPTAGMTMAAQDRSTRLEAHPR